MFMLGSINKKMKVNSTEDSQVNGEDNEHNTIIVLVETKENNSTFEIIEEIDSHEQSTKGKIQVKLHMKLTL